MEKKSFRPRKPQSPSYPPLREVNRGTVTGWGLATLGGLLLGGAGPARAEPLPPPGVPPVERVEKKPEGKAAPDAGTPEPVAAQMGKPVAPRFEEGKRRAPKVDKSGPKQPEKNAEKAGEKKADPSKPKPGQKDHTSAAGQAGTGNAAAVPQKADEPRMMGKMRMPRVGEAAEDEPAQGKKEPPKK